MSQATPRPVLLLCVALAAVIAYAPALRIPLIADDFPNIAQALTWGAPEGFSTLLHDPQFRLRATSYWTMFALWQVGELAPWVYHGASLLLHILNAWLVFAVASTWERMRAAAPWAAFFFAIHEGHQEAVMWFSAVNELLMFCFGMASLWCWLRKRDGLSAVLFALALLSKESAIVLLPLFLLTDPHRWRRLAPHAVLVVLAVASIVESHANSFRFNDGSFSLGAPFWITWPRSLARLLWFWGWLAAIAIWLARDRGLRVTAGRAIAWMGIALVPYSFLTYSTQIPSRQTYLAGAGLALLVGLAAARMPGRRVAVIAIGLMLVSNVGYLWTKKRAQFEERAAPTTQLIGFAERTRGR
ncbi:MAG TPA: hypothetical protein VNV86_10040, partial [Candidatus Acidoferrum sp.]|nr:hypothetical protein [Candidatus Acidoferrum sp.]